MAEFGCSFNVEAGVVRARCSCGWFYEWIPGSGIDADTIFATINEIWKEHMLEQDERYMPHDRREPEFRERQRLIRWPSLLWSNPLYGLYHGPKPLRALAAWILPRWAGSWYDVG